jgi:hypothetical protein
MLDVARLQADAEDAQIRSEMARSQLQAARSNLLRVIVRWSEANDRSSIARSVIALDRSRHRPIGI